MSFSHILQGTDIIISEQDDKNNRNVVLPLTASKKAVYEWNRTWGGVDDDRCYGVAVDSLDNIYIVGRTTSFGAGSYDMVLVKYDGKINSSSISN